MWAVLPRTNILTGIVVTAGIVLLRRIAPLFQGQLEAFGERDGTSNPFTFSCSRLVARYTVELVLHLNSLEDAHAHVTGTEKPRRVLNLASADSLISYYCVPPQTWKKAQDGRNPTLMLAQRSWACLQCPLELPRSLWHCTRLWVA